MNESRPPLISVANLNFGIGETTILQNINLEISAGEILTLVGPNGAGKTTLVRVLLGLLKPDSGEIRRKEGISVGYLPQAFEVDPSLPLTVRRLLSLTQKPSLKQMEAHLEEVGARNLLDHPVQSLSGGERQRVLLARALLRNPELLVLDEPIQNVDINGQTELYRLIMKIRDNRGCGVLMISHDLHLVMAFTDLVVCLNKHICCSGHPEAVSKHPEYLALFGKQAAESLAVYTHRHDHVHGPEGEILPIEPEEIHHHHGDT
ncbi:MAG: zinc ABC transporter ATP-binding protein ZnuC [Nitrospinae bacterium]|nr:zinc ABC transporter ATP-binding protein ZnuC [Nitrospinota bacterium]